MSIQYASAPDDNGDVLLIEDVECPVCHFPDQYTTIAPDGTSTSRCPNCD